MPRITLAVGAITMMTVTIAAACATAPGTSRVTAETSIGAATSSTAPTPSPSQVTAPAKSRAAATKRVTDIISSQPRGAVSVAALNTVTGAQFAEGASSGMWTASTYKLLVVTALLLDSDDSPSDAELSQARRAIVNSDNAAGYSLFLDAGGTTGLKRAVDILGMTHTVPGRIEPALTTTSALDYIQLLKALTTPGASTTPAASTSPAASTTTGEPTTTAGPKTKPILSRAARSLIVGLMRATEADQRWGVSAAADRGTRFANKNGWLSIDDANGDDGDGDDDDAGLWAVASVGVISVHEQQVLMAVFTQHQRSFQTGVSLVAKLARATAPTVSP